MPRRLQLAAGQRRAAALVATPSPETFDLAATPKPARKKAARKPATKRKAARKGAR